MSAIHGAGASKLSRDGENHCFHQGASRARRASCSRRGVDSITWQRACGYRSCSNLWVCNPPLTGAQSTQVLGCSRIHCRRSSMRRPISSCNHGDVACGQVAQRALATGSMVGGRSAGDVSDMPPLSTPPPPETLHCASTRLDAMSFQCRPCCLNRPASRVFVLSAAAGPVNPSAHAVSSALPNPNAAAPLAHCL